MKKEELIAELEKIVEIDSGSMNENDSLEKYLGWDSLAVLSFMAMVDSKFQCQLDIGEIDKCKTVNDLLALLVEQMDK